MCGWVYTADDGTHPEFALYPPDGSTVLIRVGEIPNDYKSASKYAINWVINGLIVSEWWLFSSKICKNTEK